MTKTAIVALLFGSLVANAQAAQPVHGNRLEEVESPAFQEEWREMAALQDGPGKQSLDYAFNSAWIPTIVSSPGQFGAYFKTKVGITNPTPKGYQILATLFNGNGLVKTGVFSIGAGQSIYWNDFLPEAMGYTGAGTINFSSWANAPGGAYGNLFIATSEVYTDSPAGKYKTVVVDGTTWSSCEPGYAAYNLGVTVSASERTNLGAFNTSQSSTNVISAEVFDANGVKVETVTFNLAPRSWAQKPLTVPVANGTIKWTVSAKYADLYAVTVNNQSNDGSMMPAIEYQP